MSSAHHPSRRDFLNGRAAALSLSNALCSGDDVSADPASAAEGPLDLASISHKRGVLMSLRRQAMACEFEVQLAAGREDGSTDQVLRALDLVEALEDQMTVYRADSEVLRINRRASERPVPVEPRLFGLLQLAERLHRDTEGAIDITSGPLSEIWGFSRRAGRVPSDAEIAAALDLVGMHHVVLDSAALSVFLRRPGVALNLNCIGKGYALDRMAESLDVKKGTGPICRIGPQGASHKLDLSPFSLGDYLLHGGRSSVLARGRCPGSERAGWTIGVRHPLRPDQRLAEFCLRDQALGTSGAATQFFHHRGRRYGHLLDPRTGWPAAGVHSATVIAQSAAEADALSTAFYVMGPQAVGRFCDAHPEVAAVLVCPADRSGDVELVSFGLADDQWQPLANC
jgi:thiamine biosynthesis lipoprotein